MSTLVLVEGNAEHATLFVELCEQHVPDCTVEVVHHVSQALHTLQQQDVACVCVSLVAQGTPGLTELTELQAVLEGIPLVALSSRDDAALATGALKAGADEFVVKNLESLTTLPSLLARACGQARKRPICNVTQDAPGLCQHLYEECVQLHAHVSRLEVIDPEIYHSLEQVVAEVHTLKRELGCEDPMQAPTRAPQSQRQIGTKH